MHSLHCYQFTLVAERVRPRSSGVLYPRTPQQPSGLRQRCYRCTGTTTKPSKAWLPASIAPAKLGFQPALLWCIQHHPPQLSHREQLRTTLGVKRLLASTHHRLSRKLQQSVRLSLRHQTQDGVSQEPRAHGHQQRRRQRSLC